MGDPIKKSLLFPFKLMSPPFKISCTHYPIKMIVLVTKGKGREHPFEKIAGRKL
jgi:hypothetical protein